MELNEIKKMLYKSNPKASLQRIRKGIAYYSCSLYHDGGLGNGDIVTVRFDVPIHDMGDADFLPEMDSKLLIRYIYH